MASLRADSLLLHPPSEWTVLTVQDPSRFSHSWPVTCVTLFLSFLRTGPSAVAPTTAFTYLAGVRFFLLNNGVDVSFFNSPVIRATKSGIIHQWRLLPGTSVASRQCLPVSISMIMGLRDSWPRPLSFDRIQFYTAMIFAFATASRVSEYLPVSRQDWSHAILSDHILFSLTSDSSTSSDRPSFVPSHLAPSIPFERIKGVLIVVREGKNDPTGIGHRYYFPCVPVTPPSRCFDLTTDLWDYSRCARPRSGTPFFLSPFGVPVLTHLSYNAKMKAIAPLFSLDPSRVSSHSLRAGAATQLAGAGVPDYVIKNFGNWSSDAFLGYVRASTNIYSNVHDILANASSFSAQSTLTVGPRGSLTHVPAP